MDEKITNKNTSQKFNVKTAGSSTTKLNEFQMKTFKIIASMKKWSTRESCVFTAAFHWYITRSIPVCEMESYEQWMKIYEQKNHVKNRVKFRYTRREVQVLHAVHFGRICFAIKGKTHDPAVFKITWKWLGIRENHQHEKVSHFS